MSDLRLNKGYAPIYSEKEQELLLQRQIDAFLVLRVLGHHADELGLSHPGIERISRICGRASDAVERALRSLFALEYVGLHQNQHPIRRSIEIDYQISPHVLFIREECLEQAWLVWAKRTIVNIEQSMLMVSKEEQPEGTSTKTSPKNQLPNHHHHHHQNAKFSPESGEFAPPHAESLDKKSEERKDQGEPQRVAPPAPHGATYSPTPRSARPPSQLRRKNFSTPLLPTHEGLAQELKTLAPTRISQARELVYTYRAEYVQAGLVMLRAAISDGKVTNPFGLLKTWLQRDQIEPGEQPARKVRSRSSSKLLLVGDQTIEDFIEG